MTDKPLSEEEVAERVRQEVDRAIKRNIKGLDFLTAPKQQVGAMAKDVLMRRGTLSFYHYRPISDEIYRVPILIVSPPSNRGYIFDLAEGQSLVEFLLKRGYDVFVVDWNPPRSEEHVLKMDDYVMDFIPDCVARVREITGEPDLTLMGYCMGGTLAVMYTALEGADNVKNLVCFTTPIDFEHMTLFRNWSDPRHFEVDRLVDSIGNIPGEMIMGAFDMMRPANRTAGVMHLWTNMWNDEYVKSYRMFDRWAAETLPLPGEFFRQMVKEFMWKNALRKNEMEIAGRIVDLGKIIAPVFSIVAQHDHVVPHPAAQPLMDLISSEDRQEVVTKGGHVSVVAGPNALKRLWPSIDAWLSERSI